MAPRVATVGGLKSIGKDGGLEKASTVLAKVEASSDAMKAAASTTDEGKHGVGEGRCFIERPTQVDEC